MVGMCLAQLMGVEAGCEDTSMDLRILVRDREFRDQEIFFGHPVFGDLPVSMRMGVGLVSYVCTGKLW